MTKKKPLPVNTQSVISQQSKITRPITLAKLSILKGKRHGTAPRS
jgi:hypothetical protein